MNVSELWPSAAKTGRLTWVVGGLPSVLVAAVALLTAFHYAVGPSELHGNYVAMGRHLLHGEPLETPGYPMLAYSLLAAALGPYLVILNAACGLAAFLLAYRWLELERLPATAMLYVAVLVYAALVSSWNGHGLILSLLMASLAALHRFGMAGLQTGAVAGLLWGLAYNVRSEVLLLFLIFLVADVAFSRLRDGRWAVRHHLALLAVFAIAMVPWALYTSSSLGRVMPGTTNGWAVAYYGFGLVPGNRYGIDYSDAYAFDQAKAIGETSPWSARSNDHFRSEYVRLVASDPAFFLQRIGWGLFTAVRVGVYLPDIRELLVRTPEDEARLRYAYADLKRAIGVPRSLLYTSIDQPEREGPPPGQAATTLDYATLIAYFALGILTKLLLLLALFRLARVLARPQRAIASGPVAAYAVSVALFAALVAALILPTERVNSILLVLATIMAERAAAAPIHASEPVPT